MSIKMKILGLMHSEYRWSILFHYLNCYLILITLLK